MTDISQTNTRATISVVIVTYNSRWFMTECLAPIYGVSGIEIIVVDNLSTDGTPDFISNEYPDIRVIRSDTNLGFAGGNNLGFDYCTADTILLLNPDAFLESADQLDQLSKVLWQDNDIAFVGPQLLNVDGSHQVGDAGYRDTLWSLAGHYLFLHKVFAMIPGSYLTNRHLLQKPQVNVDWICGACLMTKRSVIDEIGGLDDSIFMYGEDVEWGERAKAQRRRAVYVTNSKIRHLQGAVCSVGPIKVSTKSLETRRAKFAKRGAIQLASFKTIVTLGLCLRYLIYSALAAIGWHDAKRKKIIMHLTLKQFLRP